MGNHCRYIKILEEDKYETRKINKLSYCAHPAWPDVEVHPSVARDLKVEDGEWVWVENERGRIRRKVKINAGIHPKTISCLHGWWLPETDGRSPNLFGTWDVGVNTLIPVGLQARTGYAGNGYKTTLVRLRKIGGSEAGTPCNPPVSIWGRREEL